ncbi:putative damage-inducible protein DinB [Bradyrhizobium sp. OAE829]
MDDDITRPVLISAHRTELMTKSIFQQLAAYNRWANARLYAAALELSDEAYRLHIGVFFSSVHGTLNHLLLTDRIWLKRITGEGEHPSRLDAILYEDRLELARARMAEDERLIAVVDRYDEAALASLQSYRTTSGMPHSQAVADILLHLFNHQTHHRGQAHACLSILTGGEPPSLDLLAFQRGANAPSLEKLAQS